MVCEWHLNKKTNKNSAISLHSRSRTHTQKNCPKWENSISFTVKLASSVFWACKHPALIAEMRKKLTDEQLVANFAHGLAPRMVLTCKWYSGSICWMTKWQLNLAAYGRGENRIRAYWSWAWGRRWGLWRRLLLGPGRAHWQGGHCPSCAGETSVHLPWVERACSRHPGLPPSLLLSRKVLRPLGASCCSPT